MNNIIILIFVLFFLSCENNSKKDFAIIVTGKFLKDDKFQLFYTENAIKPYAEIQSFYRHVNGRDNFQKIRFNFPKSVYPEKFRLDIGENIDQKRMIISNILIEADDKSFEIKPKDFSKYFAHNEFIKNIDYSIGELELISDKGLYDPFLLATPLLIEKLVSF